MILFLVFTINFRYLQPSRPVYIRFSHSRGDDVQVERIASPAKGRTSVLERYCNGAGIEELEIGCLSKGLYLQLVAQDTTILVVTDLNITVDNQGCSVSLLATKDKRPIPGLSISVFGEETKELKTDQNGAVRFSGRGRNIVFAHNDEDFWIGEFEIRKIYTTKQILIFPLDRKDGWFYFAALYLDDFLPVADAAIRAELIRDGSLIYLYERKTDRFGSIVDSIKIDRATDRMILIADDTRAVHSFWSEIPITKRQLSADVVAIDRKVYQPDDTLYGVYDQDSVTDVDIIDPSGMRLEPDIEGGFFQLPLIREGRYQIAYGYSTTNFFVGRRGPLTYEEIPILIRPTFAIVKLGDEITCKLMGPLKSGVLLYRFCDQSGIVEINDGRGEIRLRAERGGEHKLIVCFQDKDRKMSGSAVIEVRAGPEVEIDPDQLMVRSDQAARIVVVIYPAIGGEVRDSRPAIIRVGLNEVSIDQPSQPGRYLFKVFALGQSGHTVIQKVIDVY